MYATVSRFEIPARDPDRLARFYREVFHWTIEPVAWNGPAHFNVRTAVPGTGQAREGIDGGLTTTLGDAVDQPLLMIHIEEATLAECLERIVAAGGAVDQAVTAVGEMGTYARFRDPEGHRWGLWSAAAS